MFEPKTALTKNSKITMNSSSIIQHSRHKSQGPMRSEKVYIMTQLINSKVEQLEGEKEYIKSQYQCIDKENDAIKLEIKEQWNYLREEQQFCSELHEDKDHEYEQLCKTEIELKKSHEKQLEDMKDRIKVVKMGQETITTELKDVKHQIKLER